MVTVDATSRIWMCGTLIFISMLYMVNFFVTKIPTCPNLQMLHCLPYKVSHLLCQPDRLYIPAKIKKEKIHQYTSNKRWPGCFSCTCMYNLDIWCEPLYGTTMLEQITACKITYHKLENLYKWSYTCFPTCSLKIISNSKFSSLFH